MFKSILSSRCDLKEIITSTTPAAWLVKWLSTQIGIVFEACFTQIRTIEVNIYCAACAQAVALPA
jgi:hypothetical protein